MSTGQLAHIGRKLTKQDDGSIGTGVHCAEVRFCGAITNVWAEGQRAGGQTNESAAAAAAAALAMPTSLPSGFQSAKPAIDARAKAATTMAQSKAECRDMAAKAVARSTKLGVSCGVTGGGSLLQALHIHTPHSTQNYKTLPGYIMVSISYQLELSRVLAVNRNAVREVVTCVPVAAPPDHQAPILFGEVG